MGNKILKIALPLIIFGVIVFVINKTQKSIDGIAPTEVNPFSFGIYINDLVQSGLKDKPYAQAKEEYRHLYDIVKTEEQIVAIDSAGARKPLLPDTTAQSCYRKTFEGYWPAFEGMAEGVFKSDWSNKTDQLNSIKTEAADLQQRKGTARRNDSLSRYLAYVDDYHAAIGFVSKVSCSSKNQYEELKKNKNAYQKKYPLCNNRSLVNQLEGVLGKAKSKWEISVKSSVNEACGRYDLDAFLNAKKVCDDKILEYNNYFTADRLSAGETTNRLRTRWYELLEDAVNDACQIENLSSFSSIYSDLRNKIDLYGSDPNDLKGRLSRKYNQLRGY